MNNSEFDRLLAQHRPAALRQAARILRNQEDAEDAVQDAALKVWSKGASVQTFRSYLLAAVTNVALNAKQSRRNHLSLDVLVGDGSPLLEILSTDSANPEQTLLDRTLSETLHAALCSLSPGERAFFMSAVFDTADPSQNADASAAALRMRLYRIRLRLRKLLYPHTAHTL